MTRRKAVDRTRGFGDIGRRRPDWGPAERAGWVALASLLVLAVVAGGTWLVYGPENPVLMLVIAVVWAAAVAASWWLGSVFPGGMVATVGVLVMIIVGPIWVDYEVLAIRGHTTVATVSRVDSKPDRQDIDYTVWLEESDGRPIALPLLTYGPPQPLQPGDTVKVVVDPQGRLDTEPPDRAGNGWMLPVTVGGAVVLVVGLALAARGPRPGTAGGPRRGSGDRTSRPESGRTRRARRHARGR